MIQTNITYFNEKEGEDTLNTLKLAVKTARELGIKNIVLSSTKGTSAMMLADEVEHDGLDITVVTSAFGQGSSGVHPMTAEIRQHLTEAGFHIHSAAHALSGAERSLSTTFHGVYPVEIIAYTLRMFGQGTKVCVEIGSMAVDAGLIPAGEQVVAIGGTNHGVDTAVVMRAQGASRILKSRIDRIICKPSEEGLEKFTLTPS